MQVQFIGVPASGKSTIVENLINVYPDTYIKGGGEYSSVFKLLISDPILFFRSFAKIIPIFHILIFSVSKSSVSFKKKIIAIFGLVLNISNYYSFEKKNENSKIVLWDELILQRALSIFGYSEKMMSKSNINKYVKWAYKNFKPLPVFIICDHKTQMSRMKTRGVPKRMKEISQEKIENLILVQKEVMSLIKTSNIASSIVIDTSLSIDVSSRKLHEEIVN